MRRIYGMLFCMLIYAVSFSQENKEMATDTIKQKTVQLDEVMVTGNAMTDPILTRVSNDYQKK